MALKHLDEQQIRDWTLEQKDRWWLENVYKGNMPQLTLRSALTGMLLGGVLSLTNLYVGAKTGWTLGVGITSVILAFAMWKVLARVGLGQEFTLLENNCMQSIATAAGYMTAPLISSVGAYLMVTKKTLPFFTVYLWIIALAVLGVLFAFPLKRRFINDEQHPFPEGRAAGVVMDALHEGDPKDGVFKAKILAIGAGLAALVQVFHSDAIVNRLKLGFLHLPHYLDNWVYRLASPRIMGVELRELTIRLDSDITMMAAGGLMGIRTGVSLMIGAVVNYFILAPWMISRGDIVGTVKDGVTHYGFKPITMWCLWFGVAMMTASSLYAFFSKPKLLVSAFRGMLKRRDGAAQNDALKDIELPMKVFVIGIPLVGGLVVVLANYFFGVSFWLGALAVPLVFVFTLIAANSTALTAITPTGALGKLTQLTYGILAPGNVTTNLMTAGITGEVAGNASNLLMDIKPGYMLGGKPRQQAIGHVLGIIAGATAAVPIFYLVFLHKGPENLVSADYPMPGVTIWKAVAEALTAGLDRLPLTARWAALAGVCIGLLLEVLKHVTKGRFWLSGVGLGLAAVIPFNTCLAMFLGSFIFWLAERLSRRENTLLHRVLVRNQEPTAAGVIAGGALMGIVVILLETFVLS
ncbi:MAG: OPT/YSL family transporter [Deltaproteobacteria bacterium]|nr:OPT/YSL family transporter [Deltaproteobacteria bacterium]